MGLKSDLTSFFNDRKVLVLGHTGFKGSWLSIWLKSLGANLVGYSRPPATSPNLFEVAQVSTGMKSIFGDICDLNDLIHLFEDERPEIVFHLAAQALVLESYSNPLETYMTNVIGTANVLESIRKTSCTRTAIIVTSDKCYENRDRDYDFKEEDRLGGDDPYSSSKACAEIITHAYRSSFFETRRQAQRVGVATARAGNVIGGGDWAKDRLIPDAASSLSENKRVKIRNPNSTRPWQHVLDPLLGYLLLSIKLDSDALAHSSGWNFACRDGENYSVLQVVEKFCDNWGKSKYLELGNFKTEKEAAKLSLSSKKAFKLLGWEAVLNIDSAVKYTSDWYLEHYYGNSEMNGFTLNQIEKYYNEYDK